MKTSVKSIILLILIFVTSQSFAKTKKLKEYLVHKKKYHPHKIRTNIKKEKLSSRDTLNFFTTAYLTDMNQWTGEFNNDLSLELSTDFSINNSFSVGTFHSFSRSDSIQSGLDVFASYTLGKWTLMVDNYTAYRIRDTSANTLTFSLLYQGKKTLWVVGYTAGSVTVDVQRNLKNGLFLACGTGYDLTLKEINYYACLGYARRIGSIANKPVILTLQMNPVMIEQNNLFGLTLSSTF